jgi:hypothetical protein
VVRASGCIHCRVSLLRTFTSISAPPSHATQLRSREQRPPFKLHVKPFSSSFQYATKEHEEPQNHPGPLLEEPANQEIPAASNESSAPWYLQVDRPVRPTSPLSERQKIPELPESSPNILQPLLQQISIDLGLDDLTILDLRKLDPPPALGSNLLMIIGTARSEKHLHVSADRLCRWLRSEYKLRPDADGLLGRNELKLKMKRKNRRAKLLGSNAGDEDMDDGVRTGWVCVNVGTVDSPAKVGSDRVENAGFVGFGRRTEGTKIVVQMLVQEKREELDLERLWTGMAKRQGHAATNTGDEHINATSTSTSDEPQLSSIDPTPIMAGTNTFPSTSNFSPISVQSRGFHTSARRPLEALSQASDDVALPPRAASTTQDHGKPAHTSYQDEVLVLLESGEFDAALQLVLDNRSVVPWAEDKESRGLQLDAVRGHLQNISPEAAIEQLGQGFDDYSSTPLLRFIHETMPDFPTQAEWDFQVFLQCFARTLQHRGYSLDGLSSLFEQLQLSGVNISTDTYLLLLRSAIHRRSNAIGAISLDPTGKQLDLAAKILQDMHERTDNVLTEDVFMALQESLAIYPNPDSDLSANLVTPDDAAIKTCDLPVLPRAPIQSRLLDLMSTLQIRITRDDYRIRLMNAYADQWDWPAFWKVWRSVARAGEPRSAQLYATMFQRVAETNWQKGAMNVLRTWIPDMDREEPQVRLEGEVLEAVEKCLAVADPDVDMGKVNDPAVKGEWLVLWRRCFEARK